MITVQGDITDYSILSKILRSINAIKELKSLSLTVQDNWEEYSTYL